MQFVKFGQRFDLAELIDAERGEGFERGLHASVRLSRFRRRLRARRAVVIVQQFRGAADHGFGQPCQLRHVNAEALFSASLFDFVQVTYLSVLLFDSQMKVSHARQIIRRVGQFVVVSGEQRLGGDARVVVQKFDHRARD